MNPYLSSSVARAFFLLLCCLLGISLAIGFESSAWVGAIGGTAFAGVVIGLDLLLKNLTIKSFSSATFGLMTGIFCAWLISLIDLFDNPWMNSIEKQEEIKRLFDLMLYCGLGFLGTMVAMRSNREEFSFIIPYVRFRREGDQDMPLVMDTNIVIDGRVSRLCATGFLSGTLVIPRFVLDELHVLADSHDTVKRERGKRGLEILEEMERTPGLDVRVHEDYQPQEKMVDTKLVQLAKVLGARLVTNDGNLGRVAELQGVPVLNLNVLAKSMRPMITPGDEIEIALVKEGKDNHQAVGYLPDGTMIVVNNGIDRLGSTVDVVVGGAVQTSAGRLIFAELKGAKNGGSAKRSD